MRGSDRRQRAFFLVAEKAIAYMLPPPLEHHVPFAARHARFAAYGALAALTGRHATYGGGGGGWDRWTQLRWGRAARAERSQLRLYLRDVVGNPFRKTKAQPAWLVWNEGPIGKLAQAAYDDRHLPSGELDPARLAVLADALEEAGCQAADILTHCRGSGPHVRGCWVIDLLLAKS